jgi:PAS domain S-box-containing protein
VRSGAVDLARDRGIFAASVSGEVAVERELARLRRELVALQATEARYRSMIAAMTEGVVVQNAAGVIIECNAAAEQILGLTRDQMSGLTSLDPRWRAIHEDGSPFPGETHPAMVTLRTGQPCRDVIMGVHKPDGQLTWVAVNTQPIDSSEPHEPRVVCTFSEITAHKQAVADLVASESRLQLAMNAARLGTWQWEIGEERIVWSDNLPDLFGIPRGSFHGSFDEYMGLIHPDDRAQVRQEIENAVATRTEHDAFHVYHRVAGSRPERWIEGHGRIFRDAQGRPVRMAGVALDVTDVHRLQQQVQQSQRLEAIGRLAGGIAHDFNNVLTVILSSAELGAKRGGEATAELEMIRDAAGRAAQLTGQLLQFARRRAIGTAEVDLGALVEGLRPLLVHLLGERIGLEITIAPGRWLVSADAGQLEQVLINLVANARDAIRDTGNVRVVLEAAPDGDEVMLCVEDDGAGMATEVRERVFEPFFTTKKSGTGLGLATSYGTIVLHGGRIEVASTLDAGSRFEVYLPRLREDRAPQSELVRESSTRVAAGHEMVLLVEDDAMIRRVAEQILADRGYRVLVAGDGVDALELAEQHAGEVSVVVTDAVMPRMGGGELARRLHARWPDLPILMVSGYDPEDRTDAAHLPRLDKPYTPSELLSRIGELLSASR